MYSFPLPALFIRANYYLVLLMVVASCYPKGPEYYSDLDLTVTDYDLDYNFGSQHSYYMADSVNFITNIDDPDIDDDVARELVEELLQEIEQNFRDRDYQRVDSTKIETADFVIVVDVIANKNATSGWFPGPPYYPWYPPAWGWGPGWGWGYPPFWGNYYSVDYTIGSVIINWGDPQEDPIRDKVQPVHWIGTFNGLLSNSVDNNAARIQASIEQAFKQSPYIQSNN